MKLHRPKMIGFLRVHRYQRGIIGNAIVVLLSLAHDANANDLTTNPLHSAPTSVSTPLNGERLSQWLLRQPKVENTYLPGLSWRVPAEMPMQAAMQSALRAHLMGSEWTIRANIVARQRLSAWLASLAVTGRVPVAISDARWLEAHPAKNPLLASNHSVVVPLRPASVTVVSSDGTVCKVAHTPTYEARAYIDACKNQSISPRVDQVWMAQPDGRVQRFGIASWNAQTQDEPAPGAWIWAPAQDSGWSDAFSLRLIEFLATQGPAPDTIADGTNVKSAGDAFNGPREALRDPVITGNDWGGIGLLQTPTARMAKAGELSISFSRAYPYSQLNSTLQPFDWLELSYRYTSISGVAYGAQALSGNQSYKDKSIDLKVRLLQESHLWPELAVGARDAVGTGLLSGEYVVANKRLGNFDASLGLGWGSLGSNGSMGNPLGLISSKFNSRDAGFSGQGGELGLGKYFRGRTSLFGGIQYQTKWEPLIIKLEYDGSGYRFNDPFTIAKPKSPFNVGAVYRLTSSFDLTFGVQRGNVATLGMAFHAPLTHLATAKINDPVLPYFVAERPVKLPDWSTTAQELTLQTNWKVSAIEQQGSVLRVAFVNADAVYWRETIERASAVLHSHAPAEVDEFHFVYKTHGIAMATHVVSRERWSKSMTQPLLPSELLVQADLKPASSAASKSAPKSVTVFSSRELPITSGVGWKLRQSLGGPDGFFLYQAVIEGGAEWHMTPNTWLSGVVNLRAFDNYRNFRYTADSQLPRVRTYIREYLTTSRVTIPNLQLTQTGQINSNQYVSAYGGYLESMYSGLGGEWLYRPLAGPLALGVDLNAVRQRNFDQKLGLRDYRVITGHATAYIETGWNDVLAKVSVGQYLAKDRGVTLDLSRRFANGVVFGAFATKTNVSSAQFGEGSFDKGIYFSIPLSALFTRSTPDVGSFVWNPLIRDGGAKLNRAYTLYDITKVRDPRTLTIAPLAAP